MKNESQDAILFNENALHMELFYCAFLCNSSDVKQAKQVQSGRGEVGVHSKILTMFCPALLGLPLGCWTKSRCDSSIQVAPLNEPIFTK